MNLQAVFGDLDRFLRCALLLLTCAKIAHYFWCRWRVQLMEKAMRQLDFETADSLVQVSKVLSIPLLQTHTLLSHRFTIMLASARVQERSKARRPQQRPLASSGSIIPNV